MLVLKLIMALLMVLTTSCGVESTRGAYTPAPAPSPTPTPQPGGDKSAEFVTKALPIIKKSCLGCHSSDAFTQSLAGWQGSKAKAEVSSSDMPPPSSAAAKAITAADRAVLTSF
jgi:hypothetical protein